jgi:hypothetical protein
MSFPWSVVGFLLRYVGPSVPDIIASVKNLKQGAQQEKPPFEDPAVRLRELEQRLATQLQVIEQLTLHLGWLNKMLRRVLWLGLAALILGASAIGLVLWQ